MSDAHVLGVVSPGLATEALEFTAPRELLQERVKVTRRRLEAIKEHVRRRPDSLAPIAWPPELLALEAEIDRRSVLSNDSTIPILRLRRHLGLTITEERILWMLIAHHVCRFCRGLVRDLNTEELPEPTTDVLWLAVYEQGDAPSWDEFLQDATLRRLGLIERTDEGNAGTPIDRQSWRASDRVLALTRGSTALDPQLKHLTPPMRPVALELEIAGDARDQIHAACMAERIVIVHGSAGYGRRSCLVRSFDAIDRRALLVEGLAISKERGTAAHELRALGRECALFGYTPLIRNLDALCGSGEIPDRLDLVESELDGLVGATASGRVARTWTRPTANIELRPLSAPRLAILWQRAVASLTRDAAADYSSRFPIAPAMIFSVGAQVADTMQPGEEQIKAALRSIVSTRLGALATRVIVTASWNDLVLPEDGMAAISELLSRITLRSQVHNDWGLAPEAEAKGVGVAALFSGPPGTGKTMAAGLIAQALGVELFQIDISRIVSKWIGETEKNLAAIFDAAEAGHAVLLFDEADSLFGKRTEVKTSNDRHANAEVNYLLQRIESFTGIVILTTNHETAIDPAFKRRLTQHVRFPTPEVEERKKLWRVMIPKKAPTVGDLRLDKLAQNFEMSGGHIRNSVLRAAFLAASAKKRIDADFLDQAARKEYEEMDKIPPAKM